MKALCACEGERFEVTITATDAATGEREAGPTMVCCDRHLSAARVLAAGLDHLDPTLAICIAARPLSAVN